MAELAVDPATQVNTLEKELAEMKDNFYRLAIISMEKDKKLKLFKARAKSTEERLIAALERSDLAEAKIKRMAAQLRSVGEELSLAREKCSIF